MFYVRVMQHFAVSKRFALARQLSNVWNANFYGQEKLGNCLYDSNYKVSQRDVHFYFVS